MTADRIMRAKTLASEAGLDALLVSPGPDLRYLTGHVALPLERLTCLVLRTDGEPVLIVPQLERPAAVASPAGSMGIEIVAWDETEDPYRIVASLLPEARRVAVDNHMWAEKVLRLRSAMPDSEQHLAGEVLRELRMRKDPDELEALREAAAAIDRVHAQVPRWLWAGRTERESARILLRRFASRDMLRSTSSSSDRDPTVPALTTSSPTG